MKIENEAEWMVRASLLANEVVDAARVLTERIRVLPDGGLVTAPALEAVALCQAVERLDAWTKMGPPR